MNRTLTPGRPRLGSNKHGASPAISVRVEPATHEAIIELVDKLGTTPSALFREAIDHLLEEYAGVTGRKNAINYSQMRPIVLPDSLDELTGPQTGIITLPTSVDWTPRKSYNLDDKYDRADFYNIVLREASAEQMADWLNKDTLVRTWPTIAVHGKLADTWEAQFPQLKRFEE